jgi:hypothetical protein
MKGSTNSDAVSGQMPDRPRHSIWLLINADRYRHGLQRIGMKSDVHDASREVKTSHGEQERKATDVNGR